MALWFLGRCRVSDFYRVRTTLDQTQFIGYLAIFPWRDPLEISLVVLVHLANRWVEKCM